MDLQDRLIVLGQHGGFCGQGRLGSNGRLDEQYGLCLQGGLCSLGSLCVWLGSQGMLDCHVKVG